MNTGSCKHLVCKDAGAYFSMRGVGKSDKLLSSVAAEPLKFFTSTPLD